MFAQNNTSLNMESQSQNQELLCCRVCLLTDCKLYNIRELKLSEAFTRLSGTPVYKDRLPQYVCTYCHTLLLKCIVFRQKCLRTMMRLMPMLQEGEVTTDTIREIDRESHRFLNLSYTAVQTVECVESSVKTMKEEPSDIDELEEVDKDEAVIERIDIIDSYLDEGDVDEDNTNDIDTVEPNIYNDDLLERDDNIIQNYDLKMEFEIDKNEDCIDNEVDAKVEKNIKTNKRKNDPIVEIQIEPFCDANSFKNAKGPEDHEKNTKKKVESNVDDNAKSDNFGTANTSDTVSVRGVKQRRKRRRKEEKEDG